MRTFVLVVVAVYVYLALALGATPRAQAASAEEIVNSVDAKLMLSPSQSFEYEAITKEPGKADRSLVFAVGIKGKEWRRLEFLAPGDVKGMRILVRSVSETYVYLPAYKKVRRVASHVKDQGFMGTAFSSDEMSLAALAPVFTAQLAEETDKAWKLTLSRREGNGFIYPKIMVEVRRDIGQPVEIRYLNEKDECVKTETRLKYSCKGPICTPEVIRMVDHSQGDRTSELVRRKWNPEANLDDDYFTVRALQRGT